MSTIRFFSGGRDQGKRNSVANEIMRIEFEKKGRMSSTDRFKLIMKRKMEEQKKQMGGDNLKPMSERARQALKQIAAKKAAKAAKQLRQSVIVQPRVYANGRLTQKGQIQDIAGNMIGEVNTKNGKMSAMLGGNFGRYKPKSHQTDALIQEAINKYSPYYIQQRKIQAMQAAGLDPVTGQPINPQVVNVYGVQSGGGNEQGFNAYGEAAGGPKQNIGVTAWGARSDNVWGTFADNAWGSSMDNVWGTNSTDVWGGIGGNPFGGKSVQFFGTGNGKNYIKIVTNFIAGILGIKNKKTADAFKQHRNARNAAARSAGPSTTMRR